MCACETCLLNAGVDLGKLSGSVAAGFEAIFDAMHVGFNYFYMFIEAAGCLFVVIRMVLTLQ